MNYEQALSWVHGLPRLADHVGVENTKRLLAKLGNPEKKLKFVHVAGTNGKGSTTMMLSSVLRQAGYRVGTSISPYVIDFRERFQLNGEMIEEEKLAQLLTQVRAAAQELQEDGWDSIVEFDAVTSAALLWFAHEKCDIVCLEVGIGGRLDSTNAVQNTLVSCITAIGKDHTEMLGETYTEIAGEKCGVLKNRCAAVCYPLQPQEAMDEITLRAKAAQCPLIVPDMQDLYIYKSAAFENRINYGGYDLVVPFPGKHQAHNAMVVVEAALALSRRGFEISDDAIIAGIEKARFPARIEILSREPLIILDGAHNPDGARALADTLRTAHQLNMTAVIGILEGKNPEQMLEILSPCFTHVYTVRPDNPRAVPAQQLAKMAKKHFAEVTACESVPQALRLAAEDAPRGFVVCGSLYLASQARAILTKNEPAT